jgi:lysophospholipase L1-like esterase
MQLLWLRLWCLSAALILWTGTVQAIDVPGIYKQIEAQRDHHTQLLILPIGASIVRGLGSDPKDGFRKPLHEYLEAVGFDVNMIGRQYVSRLLAMQADKNRNNDHDNPRGSMKDGQHEGIEGEIVSQISHRLDSIIHEKPNLVLINAGTNNAIRNVDMKLVHDQLSGMLDTIMRESPRAAVMLSTLLVNDADESANARVNIINREIRSLIRKRRARNEAVYLAEMNDGEFITAVDLIADGIHPNNGGYEKMAAVFGYAIMTAYDNGQIGEPENFGTQEI